MRNRLAGHCLVSLGLALLCGDLAGREPGDTPQSWLGSLEVGAVRLRLRFDIRRSGEGPLRCEMTSIDQGNSRVKMDTCQIEGDRLVCTSRRLKVVYEGRYQQGNTEIVGSFTQAGQSFPLKLKATTPPAPRVHIETWQGTMQAGEREFEFQFRVLQTADQVRSVELDSFSEGIGGLYVKPMFQEDGVSFEIVLTKARFVAKYNAQRDQLDGHWLQNGSRLALVLKRVELSQTRSVVPPPRPQTPGPPFPYQVQEVAFTNPSAEITLAGTLTIPTTGGPFPGVILITGSGPQDRDETIMEHKPFWVLADHLTRAGLAVLRYDERGVGASTGKFTGANSRDLAEDVEAALAFLKQRAEVDGSQIGLIGHSEGGYVAPMIAARRDDVAWIVMLAGTGVTGEQILLNQAERIARAGGAKETDISLNRRLQRVLFHAVRAGTSADQITSKLEAFVTTLEPEEQKHVAVSAARSGIPQLLDPWFRFFLDYDPSVALARVRCPVLVLNGERDLQVDPELNLPAIRAALRAGGNQRFEIHTLSRLNHLFQECRTGLPGEYRQIEQTMAPVVLERIARWIRQRQR